MIAEIVLREYLGYTVVHSQSPSGSAWADDITAGVMDADMENWYVAEPAYASVYEEIVTVNQDAYDLGQIGYEGRTGFYVMRSMLDRNPYVDYYRFYQNLTAASELGFVTVSESQLHALVPSEERCKPDEPPHCGS
eukprot:626290-Amphidinium_carterae.1